MHTSTNDPSNAPNRAARRPFLENTISLDIFSFTRNDLDLPLLHDRPLASRMESQVHVEERRIAIWTRRAKATMRTEVLVGKGRG